MNKGKIQSEEKGPVFLGNILHKHSRGTNKQTKNKGNKKIIEKP